MEENSKEEKMSYEQLSNVAHQLGEQNNTLYRELQRANLTNMFKRLDYLFKILEFKDSFSEEYVKKCTSEIEEMMTIPEKEETDENK